MLTVIFQWLTEALGGLLDAASTAFLECLDMRPSSYLTVFPLLANIYSLLQNIGLGMTGVVAAIAFYNFFGMKAAGGRFNDTPAQILVRTAIASGMIYFGGYILERVVQIAAWSYQVFNALEVKTGTSLAALFSADAIALSLGEMAINGGVGVTDLALSAIALLLTALITYNLLKIILEVAERYMMVGVLVYTSPLIYCTIASGGTMQIFKSWVRMVTSACMMMSFSSLFLKLIMNGLRTIDTGSGYWLQLLLILAVCKIAQRVDSYLNQIGLNAPITGGGMLEDIAGMVSTVRAVSAAGRTAMGGNRDTGSRGTILGAGKNGANGSGPIRAAGIGASVINGVKQGRAEFINGASVTESMKAGAKAAGDTMKRNPVGGAVAGAVEAKKNGTSVAEGAKKGAVAGFTAGTAQFVAPDAMNAHRNARTELGTQQDAANAEAYGNARETSAHSANQPLTRDLSERIHDHPEKPFTNAEADANYARFGIADEGASAMDTVGAKPMEAYRTDAIQSLKKTNDEFAADYAKYAGSQNGVFSEGDPNYITTGAFMDKWGDTLSAKAAELSADDAASRGAGSVLSDRATAAGLSIQSASDGSNYVAGRDDQTGAFLANEYSRPDPVPEFAGVKSGDEYIAMAAQAIAADPASAGVDPAEYSSDFRHMGLDEFHQKYAQQLGERAEAFRAGDVAANGAANESYRSILRGTAENASPNAIVQGFFDHSGTMEGNDALGNAMMERGFTVLAADREAGTTFRNIRASDRPETINEVTGNRLYGGRVLEADYTDVNGHEQSVRIYDQVAYTSMSAAERSRLSSYVASDGRQLWTDAAFGTDRKHTQSGHDLSVEAGGTADGEPGSRRYAEPSVLPNSSRRRNMKNRTDTGFTGKRTGRSKRKKP